MKECLGSNQCSGSIPLQTRSCRSCDLCTCHACFLLSKYPTKWAVGLCGSSPSKRGHLTFHSWSPYHGLRADSALLRWNRFINLMRRHNADGLFPVHVTTRKNPFMLGSYRKNLKMSLMTETIFRTGLFDANTLLWFLGRGGGHPIN